MLVIVVAAACYVVLKKHLKKAPAATSSTQQEPKWIDVDKNMYPPNMITGVPISRKGSIALDRYYYDQSGIEHGEYAFTLPLSGQHDLAYLYSGYLAAVQNEKQITVQSHTPSQISLAKTGYTATATFTSPDTQTALVDINYTYQLNANNNAKK